MLKINNKQLCESCFCETNGETCPNCGFSAAEYSADPLVLPVGTKLNDKIIIGRVMDKGGFGVTYLGYDLRMGKIIAIKEYYPKDTSDRYVFYKEQTKFAFIITSEVFKNIDSCILMRRQNLWVKSRRLLKRLKIYGTWQ